MKAMQRPTVMTETILEFFEEDLRESAIRYLSNYLLEEIVVFYMRMVPDNLDVRPIKRLANVLTLFQCVAANDETREKFVNCMPLFSLIYHISMGLGFVIIRGFELGSWY
ncbi:hypothetical protein ACMD2_12226 [Ananas comosus]|uniref:Uncharacterized protein n=1 Tax=Ananas comosus TaxID=4615 RepID=A0A199UD81_ANACO|nr:hypothetical protein ACMD2_12226 [Ananas comosus]